MSVLLPHEQHAEREEETCTKVFYPSILFVLLLPPSAAWRGLARRLVRPQSRRFQKPTEIFQVQLRVQSSPSHRALINLPPTKSAHIKRRQCFSLIHVGSPMVMVHWLLEVLSCFYMGILSIKNRFHLLRIITHTHTILQNLQISNIISCKTILTRYPTKLIVPFSWFHFPAITTFHESDCLPW